MGDFQVYKCDYNFEHFSTGHDIQKCKLTIFSSYTEGRNRLDPLAILTIPTTILHDPPTIPHTHVPIPVRVVTPLLLL